MENITICGPYSQSGYGVSTQGLIRVAKEAGHNVKFLPLNLVDSQHEVGFSDNIKEQLKPIIIENDDEFIKDSIVIYVISLPVALRINLLESKQSIIYVTTETIKIAKQYAYILNQKFDKVITATNFNKLGYINSGVENSISILPHYIDLNIYHENVKPLNITNKKGFNFIYNCDYSYRKGLHILLDAFCKTFTKEDDVSLTLKLTSGSFTKDGEIATIDAMNELLYSLNIDIKYPEHAPILLLTQHLKDKHMPNFYKSGDCYVSPHLGEGFGLTILEAMAVGLPVICSRCSGPLDFVNRKFGLFIDLDNDNPTQPITDPTLLKRDPLYKGLEIYNISTDSLCDKLKYAYEHQDEMKTKGILANQYVYDNFNICGFVDMFNNIIQTKADKIDL